MSRKIVEIVNGVARHPLYRMREPINFVLHSKFAVDCDVSRITQEIWNKN
jgi:hypothetical protein